MITNKLIVEIKSKINDNQKQGITGGILQGVLLDMVESLSEAYPQIYTPEQKAQARANIDALSNYDGAITKEKLSAEVQAILDDVANKQNITDESLATIAKTIVGAINEVYNGGLKDASIATSKIEDGAVTEPKLADGVVTEDKLASSSVTNAKIANASVSEEKIADNSISTAKVKDGAITEPKLDTDLVNVITSAVQPAELESAIATALASYVAKTDILDTTGSATDKVMSQHGVTEAINGVTNKVTELAKEVDGKQDALTLTVKDNGNIVISNIQGQSKEFMPATPSGDPMHYAYEAAGAIWNGTGADITRIGRMTGDTIIHKAGFWYLNELGDISNEEMRKILIQGRNSDCLDCTTSSIAVSVPLRTNLYPLKAPLSLSWINVEVLVLMGNPEILDYTMTYNPNISSATFYLVSGNCRKILTIISSKKFQFIKDYSPKNLEFFKLKDMALSQYIKSPYFREDCILYMIQNEAATSAITITLHADVYNRCMANADILAALQAHTNISLASA